MHKNKIKTVIFASFIIAVIIIIVVLLAVIAGGYRYVTFEDGAKFIGVMEGDQPVDGKIKYANGLTAIIDFEASKITYSTGDEYIGDIKVIYRNGNGTLRYADTGDIYTGAFLNDALTGFGLYTYSDGASYSGNFSNGIKSGSGTYTTASGDVYTGNFENGMANGYGIYTSADKKYKYEGSFVNDVQNGEGKCEYANGDTYEGMLVDNVRQGRGRYVWANGESYEGNFVNGLRDTRLTDENGNFVVNESGEYVHGEQGVYRWLDGRVYTGFFQAGEIVVVDQEEPTPDENASKE